MSRDINCQRCPAKRHESSTTHSVTQSAGSNRSVRRWRTQTGHHRGPPRPGHADTTRGGDARRVAGMTNHSRRSTPRSSARSLASSQRSSSPSTGPPPGRMVATTSSWCGRRRRSIRRPVRRRRAPRRARVPSTTTTVRPRRSASRTRAIVSSTGGRRIAMARWRARRWRCRSGRRRRAAGDGRHRTWTWIPPRWGRRGRGMSVVGRYGRGVTTGGGRAAATTAAGDPRDDHRATATSWLGDEAHQRRRGEEPEPGPGRERRHAAVRAVGEVAGRLEEQGEQRRQPEPGDEQPENGAERWGTWPPDHADRGERGAGAAGALEAHASVTRSPRTRPTNIPPATATNPSPARPSRRQGDRPATAPTTRWAAARQGRSPRRRGTTRRAPAGEDPIRPWSDRPVGDAAIWSNDRGATTVSMASSTPVPGVARATRCPSAAARLATSPPTTAPADDTAWNRVMIERWLRRCNSTAWEFMATSVSPSRAPRTSRRRTPTPPLGRGRGRAATATWPPTSPASSSGCPDGRRATR